MSPKPFIALLAATVLLVGCSGSGTPATGDLAAPARASRHTAAERDEYGTRAHRTSRMASGGGVTESSGATAANGRGATRANPGTTATSIGPSVVTDAVGDQFAVADDARVAGAPGAGGPSYSDIVRASVEERRGAFHFTLRFAGSLPEKVDDDENLIAGIGLTGPDERTFSVIVQGTMNGWTAAYRGSDEGGEIEDWTISGAEVSWTVPKSDADVGPSFEWGASSRLFEWGNGDTNHVGDKAPESGPRSYPEP